MTNVTVKPEVQAKINEMVDVINNSLKFSDLNKGTLLTMGVTDERGVSSILQYGFDFNVEHRVVMSILRESSMNMLEGLRRGHKPSFSVFMNKIKYTHGNPNSKGYPTSSGLSSSLEYIVRAMFKGHDISNVVTTLVSKDKIPLTLGNNRLKTIESLNHKLVYGVVTEDFFIVTYADYTAWKYRCPVAFVTFK